MSLSDATVRHLQGILREPAAPDGRYALGPVIGEGGMGTVYRARDLALEREVALKVLRADLGSPDAAARLRREARILARLEHPGLVPVHDVGTLGDGRVFYVMKLVRGERLERALRDVTQTEALRLFLRVAETVGFAHAQGVIHRDLKPSNIMVGPFGEVLVLDWGIARVLEADGPPDALPPAAPQTAPPPGAPPEATTSPGTVLGTPGFMSPEQAHGRTDLVGPRSDVFALGAILRLIVEARAPVRPPRPLVSVWTRAMQPEPAARYASAGDLADEIRRFLDGEAVEAHRESLGERCGRLFRRYQTAVVLVLTYLTVRLLFLALRGL